MYSLFENPSFFFRYRHYLVLLVSSQTIDDHLEWVALVQSKIRNLIGDLDRNRYISFARLNPIYFDNDNNATAGQIILTESPYCSMWFIGIEFERIYGIDVDLTEIIQNFTNLVILHAVKMKVLKEGMSIETRHVKRKNLSQYLGVDFLKCERRYFEMLIRANQAIVTKRKRQQEDGSNESAAKRSRVSEPVRQPFPRYFGVLT